MDCNDIEILLVDYLDGRLPAKEKKLVEEHLSTCSACRQAMEEYKQLFHAMEADRTEQPSAALKEKFDIMLQSELNIAATGSIVSNKNETPVIPLRKQPMWLKIAASIILVVLGAVAGILFQQNNTNQPSSELAGLKNQINEMREALLFNMLQDESASKRIQAVSYAEEINQPDTSIIHALVETMDKDENVNVRLAALYAVDKYSDEPGVRDALVASLRKQKEPLMQIALINLLTEKKETKAIGPIRDILKDSNTMQPVKEIAQKGLHVL